MIGFHTIRGGRYKCDFCNHTSFKTSAGAINHLNANHIKELNEMLLDKAEKAEAELRRERNKPPRIETREKIVYKDKPEPKYWYVRNYGMEGIYCTTCKQVQTGVGIPYGQTIENTPHQCGNRTLLPVVEVK